MESLKTLDRRENSDANSLVKKLEIQIKDVRGKLSVSENLHAKKNVEIE